MLIELLTMVVSKDGIVHDFTFLYHFMLLRIYMYFIIIKIKAIFIMRKQSNASLGA